MTKKKLADMSIPEIARWCALLDAVDIIEGECIKKGHDFENIKMSPIGIERYINSSAAGFTRLIESDMKKQCTVDGTPITRFSVPTIRVKETEAV